MAVDLSHRRLGGRWAISPHTPQTTHSTHPKIPSQNLPKSPFIPPGEVKKGYQHNLERDHKMTTWAKLLKGINPEFDSKYIKYFQVVLE